MRQRLIVVAAVVVGLLCAFGLGRWSHRCPAPAVVEAKRQEERQAETVQASAVQAESSTTTSSERERIRTRTVYLPSGEIIVDRTEARREDRTEAAAASVAVEAATTRESVRVEEVVRIVESRPDWRASLLVGYDLHGARPVVGGQLERRILGPIHVGAWALPQLRAGGLSVGVTW